jgi:hypothetical protein
VGVLDRFEKGIEKAVNGAFAKAFKSEVQPVEIASALRRECDDRAAVMGRNRTIAPNSFVVELSQSDSDRLADWQDALTNELRGAVHGHAVNQHYSFVGPVTVTFERADDLDTGVFRIRSSTSNASGQGAQQPGPPPAAPVPGPPPASPVAGPPPAAPIPGPPAGFLAAEAAPAPYGAGAPPAGVPSAAPAPPGYNPQGPAPTPTLDVDGQPYRMTKQVTVIGRATDADIVLDDPGVSRRHAEVHMVDGQVRVVDLGSTNGTYLNGERVHAAALGEGGAITVGRTRIVFHGGQW